MSIYFVEDEDPWTEDPYTGQIRDDDGHVAPQPDLVSGFFAEREQSPEADLA